MSYLFLTCETKDCTAKIGWRAGTMQGDRRCKWCQAGAAYYADGSLKKACMERKKERNKI